MKRFVILSAAAIALAVYAAEPAAIRVNTPDGMTTTVTPLNDNIVRVTRAPQGYTPAESSTVALRPGAFSGTITPTAGGGSLLQSPTGLTATVTPQGEVLLHGGTDRVVYDNGRRTTDADGRHHLRLTTTGGPFHGAGERGHSIDLSGDTLVMYNRQNYGYTEGDPRISQMNITMPLLVSPRGYAIVMDDFAEATMTAGPEIEYTTIASQPVSYYFVNSPEGYAALPRQLSELTGRQDLAPLWSLGYITSKYGYKTQQEVDSVVGALKKGGYPLDGIVLDLYWYGKEQDMGRLAWEPSQWPSPEKMLRRLKKQGVNLVAISQPYVLRNGRALDNYNELSPKGMFGKDSEGKTKDVTIWVGEGGMFDVSNPDTRAWLRERYRILTDGGITGWWGDLGEPEVHPDSMYHANGLTTREYHNLYGNDWSRIIYDLFREEYPETRLMTLMRGGTVGLQRYSVFPWSTDVSRSWGGLQPQVKIMLNSGLSGLGYMSHDVGGFAIDDRHPYDPELYVRWLQLGLFSPVLRTHAQRFAEPFHYPSVENIVLPLIKARYEWLPYNYTLAYENASQGLPLVRPIGMYSPDPEQYSEIADEYLWGRDLLVAPVMTQGATERTVALPAGSAWVDYNDPSKVYDGGTTVTATAPLERIPLYVRAGALIPKARYKMASTGDYRTDNYTVEYYPTAQSGTTACTIYEDDLTSATSLASGRFAMLTVTADNAADGSRIGLTVKAEGTFPGMAPKRTLTFEIHNVSAPLSATATTGTLRQEYDSATRTLTLRLKGAALPADLSVTF